MKILSCNFTTGGTRQFVLAITTMHVIDTRAQGKSFKKLPIPLWKNWKQFEEKEYSIQYPLTWILNKPEDKRGFVLFSQSDESQEPFRENINLSVQDLTGRLIDLDKYVELSEKQIHDVLTHVEIIESERFFSDGNEFHKLNYTGVTNGYKLEFMQYYWVKNNNAYVLTLTCKEKDFEKHRKTAEKIMDSFRLLDNADSK